MTFALPLLAILALALVCMAIDAIGRHKVRALYADREAPEVIEPPTLREALEFWPVGPPSWNWPTPVQVNGAARLEPPTP